MADKQAQVLESQLEYLSLSKPRRILYKFTHFFTSIPKKIKRAFSSTPGKARKLSSSFFGVFRNLFSAFRYGDWKTRLSALLMGFGLVTRRQILRGVFYFLFEAAFIFFMIIIGAPSLGNLGNLGYIASSKHTELNDIITISVPKYYDNSFTILLYSIITIFLILLFVVLWYNQLVDSKKLQDSENIGKYASDRTSVKNIFDKSYATTLLAIPIGGLFVFTILPMVMMIAIAFTDYDYLHEPTDKLFEWVGFYNFGTVFSITSSSGGNSILLQVFGRVLLWTLVWAFFATFSNYFIGMVVAMIINIKGIKLKKLWRTVLITTIAIPQFISLLLISQMFSDEGIVNSFLQMLHITSKNIRFLSDPIIAKITIILVNTWVGIPYTMLICTGLLMNIPEDLYESARIDGASPFTMYFKITLPYMLFVTGPYLIHQFVGNINNFNVIYLLSQGGPSFTAAFVGQVVPALVRDSNVGQTDLLITWIYKITTNSSYDYGMASVLGLMIFVIIAFFSLIFYSNSSANKDEEAFQ